MSLEKLKDLHGEKALFGARSAVAGLFCALLVGLLIQRLYDLQVKDSSYYQTRADDNRMRTSPTAPVRGLIYDRNGVVLAQNSAAFVLELVPEQVSDLEATLAGLTARLGLSEADLSRFRERLRGSPRYRAVVLRSNLSFEEVARFELNRFDFPGVSVNAVQSRSYPLGASAAHVIGYVGGISEDDLAKAPEGIYDGLTQIGKTGIEKAHEDALRGVSGTRIVEANAYGRPLRELFRDSGESGSNLILSLDVNVQAVAEQALRELTGAVVAIDPRTGEVIALVSKPGFDPHHFVEGIDNKTYQALLADPARPLYNRALAGTYPPGSTIKPFMALAGLEHGVINPAHREFCGGQISLPGSSRKYRCWKRQGHGSLDMVGGVMQSCDVYFYRLAIALGVDRIAGFLDPFGLGHATGVDLPLERGGVLPSSAWKRKARDEPWYPGETLSVGIGQGFMTVTPMQLAQITARMAMRGLGYTPHLVVGYEDPQTGVRTPVQPKLLARVPNSHVEDWEKVIDSMEAVVKTPGGTAFRVFGNAPYSVAGKTGTAQVASLAQDGKAPKLEDTPYHLRDHALFVAFAPAEDPRIAIAVIAEHAGGGSAVAAPIAREVIDQALLGEVLYQRPPPANVAVRPESAPPPAAVPPGAPGARQASPSAAGGPT